jgi:hypothetical protein
MKELRELNRIVSTSTAANNFTMYAKAMMAGRFRPSDALAASPDASRRVKEILAKGAVAAGTNGLMDFLYQRDRDYCIAMISSRW